ncbi:TRAP transporter substrate-binding protein DctP [Marinobacter sp.]|uniref:TRAP transporter substrate-binding protein n=1 Tax=Marinobacter sp. TaxID=50741 RepID=UPI001B473B52|nr:TRAP transporter substrate-binding protein DctP [Marinobacter sp.]MBQ0832291.1 TRAP transporter substrate-binding protein DctP [Marinobacter sp.]
MKHGTTTIAFFVAIAATPSMAQEVTLKIADSLPADHIITHNTTDVFMERVKEELGDRVAFEHYPAQQLAKAKDMLAITQAGIADIGYIVPSYVSEKMPLGGVVELPGEISSSCEGTLAFRNLVQPGGVLDELEFQPNGVRVLYNVALSPYQAFFSKRAEVKSLEDFDGMKMRSNPGAMELSLQSVGAAPIRMTPPEIFDAMSKGTIDGALLPYTSIFSYGLNQITGSSTENANFGTVGITYAISENKWNSLPEDIQEVLTRIGQQVTESACSAFDEAEKTLAAELSEKGATVFELTEEESTVLNDSFESVAQDWAKRLDSRGKKGSEILSIFREQVETLRAEGT